MANRVTRWSGTDESSDGSHDTPSTTRAQRLKLTRRGRVAIAVLVLGLALGATAVIRNPADPRSVDDASAQASPSSPLPSPSPAPPPPWGPPTFAVPPPALDLAEGPSAATIDLAQALFARAPVIVVVPPSEPSAFVERDLLARWLAVRLQAPVVHAGPRLSELVDELDVRTAVAVGLDPDDGRLVRDLVPRVFETFAARFGTRFAPGDEHRPPVFADPDAGDVGTAPLAMRELDGPPTDAWLEDVEGLLSAARGTPAPAIQDVGLVTRAGDRASRALVSTAGAAGLPSVAIAGPDPRASDEAVQRLSGVARILRVGDVQAWADVDAQTFAWQLEVVATGVRLPGGGQTLLPDKLLVALYGHPDGGALGALGEQPPAEAVVRVRELAAAHQQFTDQRVVPTFELIATVASGGPGPAHDYSRRTSIETLRPWVEAAADAGVYVVLDLQSGRTSFLDQAREYEELLRQPHVGLALDPEWRLGPTQVHLRQIGGVDAAEVNATAAWLAELVRRERLPQKLFLVHQFTFGMIRERPSLSLGYPELAPVIQMDGQGGQASKDGTYRSLTTIDPPAGVWWGWKNFYDEDLPGVRSPEATLAVQPRPVFVSYQ